MAEGASATPRETRHAIAELTPLARIHVGKTADWVAVTDDAVWVGTTGPDGVARIDSRTNTVGAAVALPGNPCAGLAVGFDALWVPLCATPNVLARVDLHTHVVTIVPGVGPADREGGIATSRDSVWLVIDGQATLARIDPGSLRVSQRITVPSGSLKPLYSDGLIWVTRSTAAELAVVNADSGALVGTVRTGPKPRFLAAGAGSVWTLNQGDGTLTRIDVQSRRAAGTTALRTPGHGGDIAFGHGVVTQGTSTASILRTRCITASAPGRDRRWWDDTWRARAHCSRSFIAEARTYSSAPLRLSICSRYVTLRCGTAGAAVSASA